MLGAASFLGVFVALILSFSHASSNQVLNQHVRALMQEKAGRIIQNVERNLDLAQAIAEVSARRLSTGEIDPGDHDALELYLFQQLTVLPIFTGIYVGWSNGDFLYVKRDDSGREGAFRTLSIFNRDRERQVRQYWRNAAYAVVARRPGIQLDYDPRNRPWYGKAMDAGQTIWVDPYLFNNSRKPGVTVASPAAIAPDRTAPGLVVGIDLDIFILSDLLRKLELGDGSAAFIAGPGGKVIAATNVDWGLISFGQGEPILPGIGDLGEVVIHKAVTALGEPLDALQRAQTAFAAFSLGEADYQALFQRFPSSNHPWMIGLIVPDAPYLEQFNRNRNLYLAWALGVAVVVGLATVFATSAIASPVERLSGIVTKLRTQGFGVEPQVQSRFREINNLVGTFGALVQSLRARDLSNIALADELRNLNANLEKEVLQRTDELRLAKEAAERHAREQENFVAVLSHEVKSPLAKISTLTQMVQLSDAILPDETMRRVTSIREQAVNLTGMVNKMLTSMAMARGNIEPQRELIELLPFLRTVIETNCPAGDNGRIDMGAVPANLSFRLDPGLAALAIGNVLTNALKYSPSDTPVSIAARAGTDGLAIEIADSGPGMAAVDRDLFGTMYRRGGSARDVPGAGLGGFIVKMAVQAHGGHVEITSRPGQGTRITMIFA